MLALAKFKQNWGLYLFTALSLLTYAGLVRMDWLYGTLRASRTPQTIGYYLAAFFAYLGILVWAEKRTVPKGWMWAAAIFFRLLLLFTTPTLSDDVYRYLWDGYVSGAGVSPYAYTIDAPELDYLDIPQRAQANNAWMASPYLPAAQAVFLAVTALFPLRPLFLQAAMLIFDLACAWLIARLLALAILPERRLLIYLWNPLVIVEVAHGAHIDAWMLLLALLAVYFALKKSAPATIHNSKITIQKSQFLSPLFLALGALTKILPLLLLPVLFWFWNGWQRMLFAALLILLLIPFGLHSGWGLAGELDGTGLFGALRIYGNQWNFNSGVFHWLETGLGKWGLAAATNLGKVAIAIIFLLLLTAVWLLARTRRNPRSALRLMSLPLMAYVLLTPTLHPWYMLILLAFLPFLPPSAKESAWRWLLIAPWLYLSAALVFSYLTYLNPLHFGELEWVRRLEWLPTLGLLLLAGLAFLYHHGRAAGHSTAQ